MHVEGSVPLHLPTAVTYYKDLAEAKLLRSISSPWSKTQKTELSPGSFKKRIGKGLGRGLMKSEEETCKTLLENGY